LLTSGRRRGFKKSGGKHLRRQHEQPIGDVVATVSTVSTVATRIATRRFFICFKMIAMTKEIAMKRITIIAMTSIACLCAGAAIAQQGPAGSSSQPQTSNQAMPETPSGSSGASGAAQSSGSSGAASPPVAGRSTLGVTVVEMEAIILGWSAKKDLLGKNVYNDQKEKIGTIDDLIISPAKDAKLPAASFAIVGVGGFLGLGKNDVAVPMEQFKLVNNQLTLPGATKDALKALPKFEYARK
jgi:sporulation protein YlmC with PRC-barrel domain